MRDVWDPWRELRRRDHIVFAMDRVAKIGGGAIYARRGAAAAIVIDPDLPRRERRAALAHELVHDERGGIADWRDSHALWGAVVGREEREVEAIVARRLVPPDALEAWVGARLTVGPVLLRDVSDEFDVPDRVARVAIERLAER